MSKGTAFALLLAGGIITLLQGLVLGLAGAVLSGIPGIGAAFAIVGGGLGIWGIVVGLILIWSGVQVNKGAANAHTWAVVGLIFSILGLITAQGLFIGPILALIGAAIGLGAAKGTSAPKAPKTK